MTEKLKEMYSFTPLDRKMYFWSWVVIIPLYLVVLKEIIRLLAEKVFAIESTTESFVGFVAFIRNVIVLFLIIVVFWRFIKSEFEELHKVGFVYNFKWFMKGVKYLFLGCVMNGVVYTLIAFLQKETIIQNTTQNQIWVDAFLHSNYVLAIISNVIVAPIVEEFVFRVIIYHPLRKIHPVVAIVGTSIFFGGLHVIYEIIGGNFGVFLQMFSYVATGMALALLYEKRRNIILCVGLHMIFNLFSMIV